MAPTNGTILYNKLKDIRKTLQIVSVFTVDCNSGLVRFGFWVLGRFGSGFGSLLNCGGCCATCPAFFFLSLVFVPACISNFQVLSLFSFVLLSRLILRAPPFAEMSFCIVPEVELRMIVTEVELRSSCWVNFWGQAKIVSLNASCEGKGIERVGLEEWPPRRSGNRVPAGRRRRNALKR